MTRPAQDAPYGLLAGGSMLSLASMATMSTVMDRRRSAEARKGNILGDIGQTILFGQPIRTFRRVKRFELVVAGVVLSLIAIVIIVAILANKGII